MTTAGTEFIAVVMEQLSSEAELLAAELTIIEKMEAALKERRAAFEERSKALGTQMFSHGITSFTTATGINPRAKMNTKFFAKQDDERVVGWLRDRGYGNLIATMVKSWQSMQPAIREILGPDGVPPEFVTKQDVPVVSYYGRKK